MNREQTKPFYLYPITSGSSGNCSLIQAGETRILVDIGLSGKKLIQALCDKDIDPESIDAIMITHEHSDHIKGVGIFSRKFHIPIYATEGTWQAINEGNLIGKIGDEYKQLIFKEEMLRLKELEIMPYAIYHDAVDPVGYIFKYKNKKITFATDLGKVDDYILNHLKGSNGLLLEFNHDVNMLEAGTYPYPLKRRVLSDRGHLSNEVAANALVETYHEDLEWVILAHLSHENNLPDLAYLTAKVALEAEHIQVGEDIQIIVANRDKASPIQTLQVESC